MKKAKTILKTSGLVGLLLTFIFVCTAFSATIGIRPVDTSLLKAPGYMEVPVCTTFDLELYFENLPTFDEGVGLVAMGLTVLWDPLLKFEDYAQGTQPWRMTFTPTPPIDYIPEKIDIYADVPFNVQPISEDHVIATITVHCTGEGETILTPRGTLDFPYNFALSDYSYLDNQMEFEPLTIKQVVPIPATALLFLSGILGLVGVRRKLRY